MAGLAAGGLNRRITIQRPAPTTNAYNEDVPGWANYATVSASKDDVSDAERQRAAQVGAVITCRFRTHWSRTLAAVDPTFQIVFEGRAYNISAVKELGFHEGLEFTAAARSEVLG